jgi:Swt1-like HEPN
MKPTAYDFIYRARLTEEALDKAGRVSVNRLQFDREKTRELVGIDVLDVEHVARAERMSYVYITVAAFENSVRELIKSVLLEALDEDWWNVGVSEKIRKAAETRMDEEKKIRWHVQRGNDPIQFTMMPNLANIIAQNFEHFEPYLHNLDWVKNVFEIVERSRNVIMHSGSLSERDMARLGSMIRDWNSQVSI